MGWDFTPHQGAILTADSILHTDNGGQTWTNVTPPQVAKTQSTFAAGLSFNANNAWFVSTPSMNAHSTSVYHTSDGGRIWTSTDLTRAYMLAWMSFMNSRTGWLLASPGPATGQEPSDLYYTSNGGKTWSKVGSAQDNLPLDDGKTGISFANVDTGWITIDNGHHPGEIVLYVTHDAGHTWLPQNVSVPSQMKNQYAHPLPPAFSSPTNGVLPVVFDGDKGTVLYFTNDGGKSWAPSSPVPLDKVSNVATIGNRTVWVTNGNSVYATITRGNKWLELAPNHFKGAGVAGLYALGNGTSAIVYTLQTGKVTQHDVNVISMSAIANRP